MLPLEPLAEKCDSFGWNVVVMDGNNMNAILNSFSLAQSCQGKPTIIIAKTVPGKGVSFMESKFSWHGKSPGKEEAEMALKELDSKGKAQEAV